MPKNVLPETSMECCALESVQQQISRASKYAGQSIQLEISDQITKLAVDRFRLKSPIEIVFLAWWVALRRMFLDEYGFVYALWLSPQREVTLAGAKYVLDFQVDPICFQSELERAKLIGVEFPLIGVELDGHDFHERTKEQATYRNKRDRELQQAGWRVYHISGSELYRDPVDVVGDILASSGQAYGTFLWNYHNEIDRRLGL